MDAPQIKALGPLEISVLVACGLFGLTTSQAYKYFSRFPKDSRKLKLLVAFTWVCELGHIVTTANTLFEFSVQDFSHPDALAFVPLPIVVSFFINGVTGMCVQGFFSIRIYRLSKRRLVPILIWILAVIELILSLLPVIEGAQESIPITAFETQQTWVVYSTMGVSAANDLLIATTLVYYLYKERKHATKSTIIILDKLITWTIETGVITSTAAILELVFFATMAGNFLWLAVDVILGELFVISLLASLNSRTAFRPTHEVSFGTTGPLPTFRAVRRDDNVELSVDLPVPLESIGTTLETFRSEDNMGLPGDLGKFTTV